MTFLEAIDWMDENGCAMYVWKRANGSWCIEAFLGKMSPVSEGDSIRACVTNVAMLLRHEVEKPK